MLYQQSTELESRVIAVANDLNSQLNATRRGVTETREVSMSINEQIIASDQTEVLMYKSATEESATDSYFHSTSIESINSRVTVISVVLGMDFSSNVC